MPTTFPRDARGRAVRRRCPDPNCDGTMQPDRDGWWRCDGLTHITDTGPLFACEEAIAPPWIEREYGAPALTAP